MKRLNKIDLSLCGLVFITAVMVQGFIFLVHTAEWYRVFYYVLGALCVGLLLCVGYCLVAMLKGKRLIVSCILLPCIGMIISILQYQSAITHFNPSDGVGVLNYFALVPFVICILLSLLIFVYAYVRQIKNCARS